MRVMIVDLFVCWKSIQCQKPNMTQQNIITLPQSHWWMVMTWLMIDKQSRLFWSCWVQTHKPFLIHHHKKPQPNKTITFTFTVLLWRNKERRWYHHGLGHHGQYSFFKALLYSSICSTSLWLLLLLLVPSFSVYFFFLICFASHVWSVVLSIWVLSLRLACKTVWWDPL